MWMAFRIRSSIARKVLPATQRVKRIGTKKISPWKK